MTDPSAEDIERATNLIRSHTRVQAPGLVPEVRLRLAWDPYELWKSTQTLLGINDLPMPFWAFAWSGGQALARYVLDHPEVVLGRAVLDIGSGSGMVGIAAALAGAASVLMVETDPIARTVIGLNAEQNGVSDKLFVEASVPAARRIGVVLAGDVFYEREIAEHMLERFRVFAHAGILVLVGDPGREHLPVGHLNSLATFSVPVMDVVEAGTVRETTVWSFHSDVDS